MRTRLDEIVEEESKRWRYEDPCPSVHVCYKRIAERAFLHGVERTDEAWERFQREVIPFERRSQIQPAPVEEKDPGHNDSCRRSCCNRRKGERRKGLECNNSRVYEVRGNGDDRPVVSDRAFHKIGVDDTWHADRRSGKDRRKP